MGVHRTNDALHPLIDDYKRVVRRQPLALHPCHLQQQSRLQLVTFTTAFWTLINMVMSSVDKYVFVTNVPLCASLTYGRPQVMTYLNLTFVPCPRQR